MLRDLAVDVFCPTVGFQTEGISQVMLASDSTISTGFLGRVQQFDRQSWRDLVARYGPRIYEQARAAGLSSEAGEDVAQEVFVAVARAAPGFEKTGQRGAFRCWLKTITANKIRDYYRKAKTVEVARGGSSMLCVLREAAGSDDPSTAEALPGLERRQLADCLVAYARIQFSEVTWRAFWMKYVDELDAATVAQELGMTAGAVRQAAYRVRRQLKENLQNLLDQE
ncbi:MAG: sigma-70 family RNA polymerase sigma factor [Planctomycetales bacterium]|nr:sigma-70 family RNA polymerase sigma factor [Planctomycetales bacterium]